jgi:hypothetical protein
LISLDLAVQKQDVYGWGVSKNGKLFKVWVLIGTIDEMRFRTYPLLAHITALRWSATLM